MNRAVIIVTSPNYNKNLNDLIRIKLINQFSNDFIIIHNKERVSDIKIKITDNFMTAEEKEINYPEIFNIVREIYKDFNEDYDDAILLNEYDMVDEIFNSVSFGLYMNKDNKLYTGFYMEVYDKIHPEIYVDINQQTGELNVDIFINGIENKLVTDAYKQALSLPFLDTLMKKQDAFYYFDQEEILYYLNNVIIHLYKTVIFEQKYINLVEFIAEFIDTHKVIYTIKDYENKKYNLYIDKSNFLFSETNKDFINSIVNRYNEKETNKQKINLLLVDDVNEIAEKVYPAFYLICK